MTFKLQYDRAVLETDSLSTSEAMVALSWASVCDFKTGGNAKQSFESVAKKAKVSRRTAIRLTQSLVSKGWLTEVERNPYRPTVYALAIPTSDMVSLVTSEAPLVTSETGLVTNEAPTSVTVSPYKKNIRTKDKNKEDKNKNKQGHGEAAPGSSETVPPLGSNSSLASDDPLLSQTRGGSASLVEEVEDEVEIIWHEEDLLGGSENIGTSADTSEAVEAVRRAPRPPLTRGLVRREARIHAAQHYPFQVDRFIEVAVAATPAYEDVEELLEAVSQEHFEGEVW